MISNEEKGCKEPGTLTSKLSPKDDNGNQNKKQTKKKNYQKERSKKLSVLLRAKTTFRIWNFYFSQILSEIVEKQHVLTPFNLFSKFSHCLTLFSIFSVHVNGIVFRTSLNFVIDWLT